MFHPIIFAKLSTPEPVLLPTRCHCPRFLLLKGSHGPLRGHLLRRHWPCLHCLPMPQGGARYISFSSIGFSTLMLTGIARICNEPWGLKIFCDHKKSGKSWGQPMEMRIFQSEDKYPTYAGTYAAALEGVGVGCTILSLGWPRAPRPLTEAIVDEKNSLEALFRLHLCLW